MTCSGFIKVFLKIMNFLFILVGLAMAIWISSSSSTTPSPPPPPSTGTESTFHLPPAYPPIKNSNTRDNILTLQFRRSLLPVFELTPLASFRSRISSAWFLYVFIAVGIVITLITCSGYIAAATANGCCLSGYSVLLGLLMILELAFAGFVFFDRDWQEVIPADSTGELDSIENFIENKIEIFKWVALGVIVLQAIALLLAVYLRAMGGNSVQAHDSDDEVLAPRAGRQPLLNRSTPSGASATGAAENRPARNDAWSTRMREKYGLDTAEFSYNPSETSRSSQQQQPVTAQERRSSCAIM